LSSIRNNIKGDIVAKKGIRIGIIKSVYNSGITDVLESGCIKELEKAGVAKKNILTIEVPGAYEIPFGCQKLAMTKKCDAIIAIGAVIKGQTPHFDFIAKSAAMGIMDVSLKMNIPIIFGVLTTNNIAQAKARIQGGSRGDKGAEAARAAIKVLNNF
jgi:6,7-dimethyl-8-ribityllumazine synthase